MQKHRVNISSTLALLFIFLFTPLFGATTILAQEKTVTGIVIDENNETIIGASVMVKGTSKGTITDIDGNFSIKLSNNEQILEISYIGYKAQEVKVGSKTHLKIVLVEDSKLLEEVVVVGYGTVRKGDVTGAISSVKPDADQAATAMSVDNLLQGKVAGVSIGNSVASPGAANSVTIRGANSLRGDNQPLYVIDNIPQASTGDFSASAFNDFQPAQDPLTSLNPQDIEDIQILKDASATAIYGSRGANGVILITTKKGQAGKVKVNASANFSILTATNLHKMLNLNEYADFRNQQLGEHARQFFKVDDEVRYIFSGSEYDPEDPSSYHVLKYENWQKQIYRTALSQNYTATINGGSDKMTYYVSTNFKDINGIVKQTGLKQGGINSNFSMKLTDNIKLLISMSGSLKKNDMMSGGDSKGGATGSVTRTAIDSHPYLSPQGEPNLSDEQRTTVWSWLDDYDDKTEEKVFRGSADLTWTINKHFSYNIRLGGNIFQQDRARWFGLQLFRGRNDNGSLGLTNLERTNHTIENLVNYNTKIKNFGTLSAVVGVTYDKYTSLNKITAARDFETMSLRTKGLHMARVINERQPLQKDYQLLSYLGRVNLSMLEGRYLATVNFRADGSSKFIKTNRWSYFPSFSLAWRMEQENFIKDNFNWIDQLKLRIGYGQTGNQAIDPYNSFANYGESSDYSNANGDKDLSLGVNNLQNPKLKWEKTSSTNIGLDFGILNNRITATIDTYYKKTSDLLISKQVGPSTGFNTVLMNQGGITNKGVELSLSTYPVRSKKFTLEVSGNIAFNKSRISDLGLPEKQYGNDTYIAYLGNSVGDQFGPANIFIKGKAPGLFWGYKTNGVIQEDSTPVTSKVSTTTPGNINFVDSNGDQVIDENDKVIIGDPNPKFTYGFQLAASYQNFTLSASFNGVHGNDIMNANARFESTPGKQANNLTRKAWQGSWTPENRSNAYPSVNSVIPSQAVLDRYIEDGSFLRCSDITLNYSFKKHLIKNIGINGLSLFASVKNAFILTSYSGYDPEVNTFAFDGLRRGIDLNSMPQPRSYIFGVNVSF